ncbi:hypothetical protein SDC9_150801 [bioreactor metagenome]|uniref:Uncharacterized protein n=1 Tax=bioreactor metagenome TaxID=1076179 RepID=A0A645EQD9_9ZZZZ
MLINPNEVSADEGNHRQMRVKLAAHRKLNEVVKRFSEASCQHQGEDTQELILSDRNGAHVRLRRSSPILLSHARSYRIHRQWLIIHSKERR